MNFSRFNQEFMDYLALLSFVIGVANYDENLSQSDKDDLMKAVDEKTNKLLTELEKDLEYQNDILDHQTKLLELILDRLNSLERVI